jgi:Fe-S-cluster containining protein
VTVRYRNKYILEGIDEIPEDMLRDLDTAYDICASLRSIAPCECCGKCCHQPYITVMDEEVERISAHIGTDPGDFVAAHLHREDGRWLFVKTADGPCAFLGKDRRCTIWPGRPEICRDFPYMVSKLMSLVYLAVVHGADPDLSYMDDSWPCTPVIKENIRRLIGKAKAERSLR